MEEGKKYISQSQLTMYEKCSEAYRRRYLEGHIIPPGIALVKGIGVHGGSKANFRQKVKSHQDLSRKDIIDISVEQYDLKIRNEGVFLTPDEETIGYKNVIGENRDRVAVLGGLYADYVGPTYQPQFVEQKHRLVLPESEYDLLAYMDMADIEDILVDLKTSKKKKNQLEADQSEQLSFYSLVFRGITGRMPKGTYIENLVDKKTPERQKLESIRTRDDLEIIVNRINVMIKGLQAGIFIPALATSWNCDPRYCGYANTCPYYLKAHKH